MSQTTVKLVSVPTWYAGDVAIQFWPVKDVAGFTHKVTLVRQGQMIARDWLRDGCRPSVQTAAYYLEKHAAKLA